jgi:hypothetical protein
LGWLGWTEEQALAADVNAIIIAHKGRMSLLETIFGKPKDKEEVKAAEKATDVMTPGMFKAMFSKAIH